MTIFQRLEENKKVFLAGGVTCIPYRLERFKDKIPGLIKGDITCVTAGSGVGKTTISKELMIFGAIEYAIEKKLNFKVIAFLLEESILRFEYSILSYLAYKRFGLRYNVMEFEAFGKAIPDDDMRKIQSLESEHKLFKSYIIPFDNIYNSFGIYKEVRDIARQRGTFLLGDTELTSGSLINGDKWNRYVPKDPEEFMTVYIDHISELSKQNDEKDLHEAMKNTVKHQANYVAKFFNYHVGIIQQQDSSKESLDSIKEDEVFASLNGLANNKELQRVYFNVIGITNLNRFKGRFSRWEGYPMAEFGNYGRVIEILKQRYGSVNERMALYMDGKTGIVKSMPKPEDKETIKRILDKIKSFDNQQLFNE